MRGFDSTGQLILHDCTKYAPNQEPTCQDLHGFDDDEARDDGVGGGYRVDDASGHALGVKQGLGRRGEGGKAGSRLERVVRGFPLASNREWSRAGWVLLKGHVWSL